MPPARVPADRVQVFVDSRTTTPETKYEGLPQKLRLPSAPKQFIKYIEEDNRPQVRLDADFEKGMGVTVGRLRKDSIYDWKFIGLSHNTLRGAAGGALLCAELLTAEGYINKKSEL